MELMSVMRASAMMVPKSIECMVDLMEASVRLDRKVCASLIDQEMISVSAPELVLDPLAVISAKTPRCIALLE